MGKNEVVSSLLKVMSREYEELPGTILTNLLATESLKKETVHGMNRTCQIMQKERNGALGK